VWSGLLFEIGRAWPFLADTIFYAAPPFALLFLREDLHGEAAAGVGPLWLATGTGLRWIPRHPLIRAAILLLAAANLAC
jgi:hypothetical protein